MKRIVHLIAAARPNFVKIAPLYRALAATDWCLPKVVHTGQHYDERMSGDILRDLQLPLSHQLNVGSGTNIAQVANTMLAYEQTCKVERPDAIVVPGDVNGTMACALVGRSAGIPVVHLEAGLRSGDRSMPEENNRIVTDSVSNLHWAPTPEAVWNLREEGIRGAEFVGNIMIDSLKALRPQIEWKSCAFQMRFGDYAVATFHRPSNVCTRERLTELSEALRRAAEEIRIIFPAHPRTRAALMEFGLTEQLLARGNIKFCPPLGYIDFMGLVMGSQLVMTDSGGVQEETTYMGIPCATVRDNTERPITLTRNGGTNMLIGPREIIQALHCAATGGWPKSKNPPLLWDGRTAGRCVQSLAKFLGEAV